VEGSRDELDAGAERCANVLARQCDCREASETDRGGVSQDCFAGVGLVVAHEQFADRGTRDDEKIDLLKEGRHLEAEDIEAFTERFEASPQSAAGTRTEPPVSVPMAARTEPS
jgi:hypothetical protein